MNYKIQPTPAVALGAYEITPIEAAGAYTIFANDGDYLKPSFLSMVRSQDGKVVYRNKVEEKQVLDPRVAYLITSLMEEVLRSGTAAGVRARYNLNIPAAGKTGTSHDGWFAGYTSELLCVVWVGFDDNRELNLEGAHSAAPIWAEFMKRPWNTASTATSSSSRRRKASSRSPSVPESGMPASRRLPETAPGSLYRGHRTGRRLPAARRTRRDHHRVRMGDRSPAGHHPALPSRNSAPTVTGSGTDGQVSEPAARRAARQAAAQPPANPPAAAQGRAQEGDQRDTPASIACV